jgi:predicted RNase H-like HicB family nuclease
MTASRKIEVLWSEEDQVWIADVPGLPFCTAHGPTPHEAVARVEQAAKAWLADAAAHATGELASPARR